MNVLVVVVVVVMFMTSWHASDILPVQNGIKKCYFSFIISYWTERNNN